MKILCSLILSITLFISPLQTDALTINFSELFQVLFNNEDISEIYLDGELVWEAIPPVLPIYDATYENPNSVTLNLVSLNLHKTDYVSVRDVYSISTAGGGSSPDTVSGTATMLTIEDTALEHYTSAEVELYVFGYANYGDYTIKVNDQTIASKSYGGREQIVYTATIDLSTTKTVSTYMYCYNRSGERTYFVRGGVAVKSVTLYR